MLLAAKKKGNGRRRPSAARVLKFSQAAMEAIFYGGFSALGLSIVPSQPWIWPSKHWWIDFQSGQHSLMRDDLRCYYLLYGARYVQGAVSVMLEHKRKDFLEMQIHHVVTVAVVFISYAYGWNRVGAVVMLLLDPADVPLHAAKMVKYVGEARGNNKTCAFLADRLFELFAVMFFVTRVALYPYVRRAFVIIPLVTLLARPTGLSCSGLLVCAHRSNSLLPERSARVDMRRPPRDSLRSPVLLVFSHHQSRREHDSHRTCGGCPKRRRRGGRRRRRRG